MNRQLWLPIANIVAFVATMAMNVISQSPGLFAQTVGQLGESRAIFFLPAGYVFSIWGVIYFGLGAYIVYQARPVNREKPFIGQISVFFIVSCVANIVWLFLFLDNRLVESTIAMLVLLGSLLAIYLRLNIGRSTVGNGERWAVHIPFSIYLGWITVATVANFAAMLYTQEYVVSFLGVTADIWAVIMLVVALGITLSMIATRRDVAYSLVIVWAVMGIYVRPFDTPVFAPLASLNAGLVDSSALVVAGVIVLALVAQLILKWRGSQAKLA